MRAVSTVVVLALLLLAGLAVLNQQQLLQADQLELGFRSIEWPLGLALLGVAVLALLLTLLAAAVDHRRHLAHLRQTEQQLQAQRNLADKAEGSRLLEVQRHLDLLAQASEHREREWAAHMDQRLGQVQGSLQRHLDDVGNSLAAQLGEVEDRLERRHVLRPAEDAPERPSYRS